MIKAVNIVNVFNSLSSEEILRIDSNKAKIFKKL